VAFRKINIIIVLSFSAIAFAALSGCATSSNEADQPESDIKMEDFSVQIYKTEPDDIARILGINRWNFSLQRDSESDVGLEAALAIVSTNEPEDVIDQIRIFTTEDEVEGMVAIYPLGESLLNADQVRIYLQLGSGSTSSVISNPFKDFSSSYTANPADTLQDNSLQLMAFSDNEPMPRAENTILSLTLDTFSE
jgi:hypothetical protein